MNSKEKLKKKVDDYSRIEQAIRFIETNFTQQPNLEAMAAAVGLSKYHFHRLFKRWAGVTPLQFLHYLTLGYTKKLLRESHSVFDASLAAGLSGGSRLHDVFITFEAVTPGEYKTYGKGLEIFYGVHATPFGECLLAATQRGICALHFIDAVRRVESIEHLQGEWASATFVELPAFTAPLIGKIFQTKNKNPRLHLLLKGTNFEVQVWRALLEIAPGAIASYQEVATSLGRPDATRAVARAIAKNPVSYLIPCHRVIRKTGEIHQYRWGTARKKALIGWEASQLDVSKEAFEARE